MPKKIGKTCLQRNQSTEMKLAIDIVKDLLLPKLEKDSNFDVNIINTTFWEIFTNELLDFEKDAQPLYEIIYSLKLNDAEKIISKLSTIYSHFIKELAEKHILGVQSEAIDYLLNFNNSDFKQEVQFFTDLENVIKKVERNRIKTELPNAFDRLNFTLSDDEIAIAIKKKEREALKEKMNVWNKEIVTSEINSNVKNKTKIISLSFIKYAVAACLILGSGFWYFNNQNATSTPDANVVTIPVKKDTTSTNVIKPEIPTEALAEISIDTKNTSVIESGLGYASKKTFVKIVQKNQKARITSIVIAIEKYRKTIENDLTGNNSGYGPIVKSLKLKIAQLETELALLKEKENQYLFDGKVLEIYVSSTVKVISIILYENTYYLQKENNFFKLTIAEQPIVFFKENNLEVLTALDKITFENAK